MRYTLLAAFIAMLSGCVPKHFNHLTHKEYKAQVAAYERIYRVADKIGARNRLILGPRLDPYFINQDDDVLIWRDWHSGPSVTLWGYDDKKPYWVRREGDQQYVGWGNIEEDRGCEYAFRPFYSDNKLVYTCLRDGKSTVVVWRGIESTPAHDIYIPCHSMRPHDCFPDDRLLYADQPDENINIWYVHWGDDVSIPYRSMWHPSIVVAPDGIAHISVSQSENWTNVKWDDS